MTTSGFGAALAAARAQFGPLCVGIDPHPALLSQAGLSDDATGLAGFAERMLEAVAGRVTAVKPQSAFFERHGSAGIAVLESLLRDLEAAGTLSILDVKRGDIGSTMGAYAQAYLEPQAPLGADAVTLSPFLGYESLRPALDLAAHHGRGVFVLALTSNPEGASIQHRGSPSVAAEVIAAVARTNETARGSASGDVGVVVGARAGEAIDALSLRSLLTESTMPVLVPGVGAQGASGADVAHSLRGCAERVLTPVSRGMLTAGLEVQAIGDRCLELRDELSAALR